MLIGYARVSTMDQPPQMQTNALAGCGRIFIKKISGSHNERPELEAALDYMREGDNYDLDQRKIKLKVITQNIDTGTPEGPCFFV